MRIQIKDDNQNWLNWGNLVQTWIDDEESRPTTVGELRTQFTANSIVADCVGRDDRVVQILSYPDSPDDSLVIMIPTAGLRIDIGGLELSRARLWIKTRSGRAE